MRSSFNDFFLFKAIDLFFGFMASIETIDVIIFIEWFFLIITIAVIIISGSHFDKKIK